MPTQSASVIPPAGFPPGEPPAPMISAQFDGVIRFGFILFRFQFHTDHNQTIHVASGPPEQEPSSEKRRQIGFDEVA